MKSIKQRETAKKFEKVEWNRVKLEEEEKKVAKVTFQLKKQLQEERERMIKELKALKIVS